MGHFEVVAGTKMCVAFDLWNAQKLENS